MENKLEKNIEFSDQSPMAIGVYEIEYCPIHIHHDIEIIYVLKGSIAFRLSAEDFQVDKGAFYIVNSDDLHDIRGITEENRLLIMHIDVNYYKQSYPYLDLVAIDSNPSAVVTDHIINNLKKIYELDKSDVDKGSNILELVDDTVATLMNEFPLIHHDQNDIMNRIKASEKRLLGTEDSIEKIAIECGFSSPEFYSQEFHRIFGYTPSEYREKKTPYTIFNMEVQGDAFPDYLLP